MPDFSLAQGAPLDIEVTLKDGAGATIVSYLGTEALSTTIWPGANLDPSITPTTTWVSAAAGTIRVAISAVDSATLYPGVFEVSTTLDDGVNDPVECYAATLLVTPASSGIAARTKATIVSVSEALAGVPGLTNLTATDATMLVEDVTDAINSYCRRVLPLTIHDERRPISRERVVRLKQYPVVTVARVCTGLTVGLTVANSTLTRPTIKLTPSTDASDPAATPVSLKLDGYSSGVAASTATLTFATYKTLSTLAAAINALGSGWSASLNSTDYANLNSADLNPDWGMKGAGSTGGSYSGAPLLIYAHDVNRYDVDEQSGVLRVYDSICRHRDDARRDPSGGVRADADHVPADRRRHEIVREDNPRQHAVRVREGQLHAERIVAARPVRPEGDTLIYAPSFGPDHRQQQFRHRRHRPVGDRRPVQFHDGLQLRDVPEGHLLHGHSRRPDPDLPALRHDARHGHHQGCDERRRGDDRRG